METFNKYLNNLKIVNIPSHCIKNFLGYLSVNEYGKDVNTNSYTNDIPHMPLLLIDRIKLNLINDENWSLHQTLHQNYAKKLHSIVIKNNINDSNQFLFDVMNRYYMDDRIQIIPQIGGVINHTMFWQHLSGSSIVNHVDNVFFEEEIPSFINTIYQKILEIFQNYFINSHWINLCFVKNTSEETIQLSLILSSEQFVVDNLCINNMFGEKIIFKSIFNLDLWEHAFQFSFSSDRISYVKYILDSFDDTFLCGRLNYCYNFLSNV